MFMACMKHLSLTVHAKRLPPTPEALLLGLFRDSCCALHRVHFFWYGTSVGAARSGACVDAMTFLDLTGTV